MKVNKILLYLFFTFSLVLFSVTHSKAMLVSSFERISPKDSSSFVYYKFRVPEGGGSDSYGNIYIADRDNHRVVKFNSSGMWQAEYGSRGSGNGQFNQPCGVVFDSSDNMYVLDTSNHRVVKLDSSGNWLANYGSQGTGNGQFKYPQAIGIDSTGNLFIADTNNNRIVKLDGSGAWQANYGTYGTGNGQFRTPTGVAVDSSGNIFVGDSQNNRIVKLNSSGIFQANYGSIGSGNGQFDSPKNVFIDSSDNVYVADSNNSRVEKINTNGVWQANFGAFGKGDGQMRYPWGVFVDISGNVYGVDTNNNRIVKYNSSGVWQSTLGTAGTGTGQFDNPGGIALDGDGNMFVADVFNHRVVKLSSAGNELAIYGKGVPVGLSFFYPVNVTLDSSGNIYVVDQDNARIVKLNSNGDLLAEFNNNESFYYPEDVKLDVAGNMYVADTYNNRIVKLNSNGEWIADYGSEGTGNGQFDLPWGLALDNNGNMYVADMNNNRVVKLNSAGEWIANFGSYGTGNGEFDSPWGVFIDKHNYLYVSDSSNGRIQKFTENGTWLASYGTVGSDNGQLNVPGTVFVDIHGDIYVPDMNNSRVVKISTLYQISGLDVSASAISNEGDIQVGSSVGSASANEAITLNYNGYPVSQVSVDFSDGIDRNWGSISMGVDINTGRSFITNLNPTDAPGAASTHTLYVPKLSGQGGVRICPNAAGLGDVSEACPGGYQINQGAANLSVVNVAGQDYWLISGLTGTGAIGISLSVPSEPLTLTPNSSAISTTQEVTMAYTPDAGFVSGDKVQFHFEPTAGFVLANTCATPTTDANHNSIADGSASIISGDIYEYTFSSTVAAGPLSFCANVTSPAAEGSYSVRLTDDNGNFGSALYYVGADGNVFVIANVAPSLSFNIRTLDDTADTNVCNFGESSVTTPLQTSSFENFDSSPVPSSNWTKGGNTNWFRDTTTFRSGVASAGNGDIKDYENVWTKRSFTITQDETLSFDWKVSSEANYDKLIFCLDNDSCWIDANGTTYNATYMITGNVDWTTVNIPVTAGTHSIKFLYGKDYSDSAGADMGWIDNVTVQSFSLGDFESTSFPGPDWSNGGGDDSWLFPNWYMDTTTFRTGIASAGTGNINNYSNTWIRRSITATQNETLSFDWKVSSEANFDKLIFCLDDDNCWIDANGVTYGATSMITGEVDWTTVNVPISAGAHTIKFLYGKNSAGSAGSDMGWIDNINISTGGETVYSQGGNVSTSDPIPDYDNVDDGSSECGYSLAVGTNAASGFQVQVQANHELANINSSIAPISNGGTFAAGVESYGITNVTSALSGRDATTGLYNQSIVRDGTFNLVGNIGTNIPLTATNFINYNNGIQYLAGSRVDDVTNVLHGLVIGSGTPAGYYDQVVTYTTTANF
jgi:DNA-binding beta-propeller fold protein YncE